MNSEGKKVKQDKIVKVFFSFFYVQYKDFETKILPIS